MNNRGINTEILDRFNILATRTPKLGVVFCNKQWRDGSAKVTDFLSIRNIGGSIRHTNLRDQVKPLLWTNYVDTDRVIIVEGAISGLAVYQHLDEKVCPLVLSGKTISSFQIYQLKEIVASKRIEKVYIATDGGFAESGIKIARSVYKALDHQNVYLLNLPWGKDPNSLTREKFREIWDNKCYEFQPLGVNITRMKMYGWRR
jgi:5S rRNA maturation endonuclease (ribonuclease M5)